jgi:prepilin-type N-terminal cleavage/methylation domain-containing protein
MKRNGFTLIEVIIAMVAGLMVMLTVALLVQSGHVSWNKSYKAANCDSRLDSLSSITAFSSYGRKSNKKDYYVYSIAGSTFTRVIPNSDPEEILTGHAVEFRFWSTDLEDGMLSPTSTADCYALFYIDDDHLKLDISNPAHGGAGPPAIDAGGHRVTGTGVTTVTLANHVTSVEFSHTARNMTGDGKGCVRMKLIINDPNDNQAKTFLAATYIRNVWPEQ